MDLKYLRAITFNRSRFIIIFLIITLHLFQSGFAQVAVGLFGAFDNSQYSGDVPRDIDYVFTKGYALGLCFDKSLQERTFISVRPNYTVGGTEIKLRSNSNLLLPAIKTGTDPDSLFLSPITNKYLALPILTQIYVRRGFYANCGLDVSYILDAHAEGPFESIDIIDHINQLSIKAVFGFGFSVPVRSTSFNIEATYSQGLNTLTKTDEIEKGLLPRLRTNRLRLAAYFIIFTSKEKL